MHIFLRIIVIHVLVLLVFSYLVFGKLSTLLFFNSLRHKQLMAATL